MEMELMKLLNWTGNTEMEETASSLRVMA